MGSAQVVFLQTLVIGLAVAMPVGAMGALCVERTLAKGWTAGVATGLGIATADAAYASIAVFGVTAVSSLVVQWHEPLRIVGGTTLVVLGLKALLGRTALDADDSVGTPTEPADSTGAAAHAGLYASSVGLTLTNPMTVIAFAGIFMSAGLTDSRAAGHPVVATVGVALGSLAWWLILVTATTRLSRGLSPRSAAWVTRASGGVVASFGVLAIASAFVG